MIDYKTQIINIVRMGAKQSGGLTSGSDVDVNDLE